MKNDRVTAGVGESKVERQTPELGVYSRNLQLLTTQSDYW